MRFDGPDARNDRWIDDLFVKPHLILGMDFCEHQFGKGNVGLLGQIDPDTERIHLPDSPDIGLDTRIIQSLSPGSFLADEAKDRGKQVALTNAVATGEQN